MAKSYVPMRPGVDVDPNSLGMKAFQSDVSTYAQASSWFETTKTANFTFGVTTFGYKVDTTSGNITATLPKAAGIHGKPYLVKNVTGSNNVVVTAAAGDTVDGAASYNLAAGKVAMFHSDGNTTWVMSITPVVIPPPTATGIFNVLDYGAVGNSTTDDTAGIQAAITAASSITSGTVFFPPRRYRCNSSLTVSDNVTLLGATEGPFFASSSSITTDNAAILEIYGTGSEFILQNAGSNPCNINIQNLVFAYPSQIAATSAAAITVYPATIKTTRTGMVIRDCTFYNPYVGIWCYEGNCLIEGCNFGALYDGIKIDGPLDTVTVNDCNFGPFYTIGSSTSFPANIDTTMSTGGGANIRVLSCLDTVTLNNIVMTNNNHYGIHIDAGVLTGRTGSSHGNANNISSDGPSCGVYVKSTKADRNGWRITNLDCKTEKSTTINGGIYMAASGTETPEVEVVNYRFKSANASCYCVVRNAGILHILNGSQVAATIVELDLPPGYLITQPAIAASTTAVNNYNPFFADVYINGGTVTNVHINGTATGGARQYARVPPYGTISITYTVAPTWEWFK